MRQASPRRAVTRRGFARLYRGPAPHSTQSLAARISLVLAFAGVSIGGYVMARSAFINRAPIACEPEPKVAAVAEEKTHPGDPTTFERMEALIRRKQNEIIETLERIDGKQFFRDEWERPDGSGGGITAVMQGGNVIEKGGCNISIIEGSIPEAGIKKMRANHRSLRVTSQQRVPFKVCGLSLIMHPVNPMAPTVHLNYRYFETQNEDGSPQAWWFGGGADLTPIYLFEEDAELFHRDLKAACDKNSPEFYPKFKKWCDNYFLNKHRGEARGIGGIFFDDLADRDPNQLLQFVEDAFDAFLKSYPTILDRRKDLPYNDKHKEWQDLRHGRYVEFNLVHDRGTAFGLHTPNARIESILVSLPTTARWLYDHHPEPGSEEERLLDVLRNPRDWVQ